EEAIIRSTRRRDKSESAVGALRTAVAAIAVEQYVQGNSTSSVELDLSAGSATRARGRRAVSGMVRARQVDALRGHTAALADARAQLESSTAELADVVARQSEVTARRDEASGREQRLAAALVADARAVGDARLTSTVRGADFVLVALDAYHRG